MSFKSLRNLARLCALIAVASLASATPAYAHSGADAPGQSATAGLIHGELIGTIGICALILLSSKRWVAATRREIQLVQNPGPISLAVWFIGSTLGLAVTLGIIYLGWSGATHDPFGIAVHSVPLAYFGIALASILIGNVWCIVAPWRAGSVKPGGVSNSQHGLIQAGGLLVFVVTWFCDPSAQQASYVASILAIYIVIMYLIRLIRGFSNTASYDPPSGIFGLLAKCSPVHIDETRAISLGLPFRHLFDDAPITTFAPAVIAGSAILFEALQSQTWWQTWGSDVSASTTFLKRSFALILISVCLCVIVFVAAALSAYLSKRPLTQTISWVTPALIPLTAGFFFAQDLYPFTQALQDQLFVIWDPFGKGWTLSGHQGININITGSYLAVVQNAALLLSVACSMYVSTGRIQRSGVTDVVSAAVPVYLGIGGISWAAISLIFPA